MGVRERDVLGKGRTSRAVVQARAVLAYRLRKIADLSFPDIASLLGRGEHTTVLVAVRRVTRAVDAGEHWAVDLLGVVESVRRPRL
jgi:chromosomal replication initiation ATPase DnaA